MSGVPKEVTWGNQDLSMLLVAGTAGMFTGVTCMLYPLSVIKTRQMVDGSGRTLGGVAIVREIVKQRGVLGLYQGFGTVVVGKLPIRMVYLSTLEVVKSRARGVCERLDLPPITHGIADAAGGATAAMCSQVFAVPVDVISQRQMLQGVSVKGTDGGSTTLKGYRNGLHAVRSIVAKDGVAGLYRGFGASIITLVPGSALWWGFYGTYQQLIWNNAVPQSMGGGGGVVISGWGGYGGVRDGSDGATTTDETDAGEKISRRSQRVSSSAAEEVGDGAAVEPSDTTVMGVQIASAFCAGATSGFLTTPLDIVKTRLQVLSGAPG